MFSIASAESSATVSLTVSGSAASRVARAPTGGCHEQIVRHRAHHLRLERRCAGESDRTTAKLLARDARRLVRFDVRPEREPVLAGVACCPIEITGQPIQIDDGNRRLELIERERHGDVRPSISGDDK